MTDFYFLLSLAIYSFWKVWCISDRVQRYPVQEHPIKFTMDVGYFVFMVYLLSNLSINFLVLGVMSFLVHAFFGIFVEFFRPELSFEKKISTNIINNYWHYVTIDVGITLVTFCIALMGKI